MHVEYETAEWRVLRDELLQQRRRNTQQGHVAFSDTFARVVGAAAQATARRDAGFTWADAVQRKLAPLGRGLQYANAAFEYQREAFAGRVRPEHRAADDGLKQRCRIQRFGASCYLQFREHRKACKAPAARAREIVHVRLAQGQRCMG
jgi:hypothetical protein